MSPPPTTAPQRSPGGDTAKTAAKLIADNLATGLVHPGSGDQKPIAIPLPAFRTTGMPEQLATHIQTTTQMIGEAIIHLLATNGLTLVNTSELDQLHQRCDESAGITPPTTMICCPRGCTLLEIVPRPVIKLSPGQLSVLTQHHQRNHGP